MYSIDLTDIDLVRLRQLSEKIIESFPTELVIGLVGTLGAGKTTFTQTLAEAAGIDREDVTSPTFTLLSSYDGAISAGPIKLHHLDAYRVSDEDEFLELGVEELFETPRAWTLVEWADRVESVMPMGTLWIRIEPQANSETDASEISGDRSPRRTLSFSTTDARLDSSLQALATK